MEFKIFIAKQNGGNLIFEFTLFFVCKLPGGAILVCDKNLKFCHVLFFANLSWVFCKRNFSILKKTVGGDRFPVTVYFENWPGNPVNWQPCRNIFFAFLTFTRPKWKIYNKKTWGHRGESKSSHRWGGVPLTARFFENYIIKLINGKFEVKTTLF